MMMEDMVLEDYVEVPAELADKYPDAGVWYVVGDCCEPELKEGDRVLVSPGEKVKPGDYFLADLGADMPTLGRAERIAGDELVVGDWNVGGIRYAWTKEVLGVVVGVV